LPGETEVLGENLLQRHSMKNKQTQLSRYSDGLRTGRSELGSNPGRGKIIPFSTNRGPGAHPAYCSVDTPDDFPLGKAAGA
jgi:hypothetical protein